MSKWPIGNKRKCVRCGLDSWYERYHYCTLCDMDTNQFHKTIGKFRLIGNEELCIFIGDNSKVSSEIKVPFSILKQLTEAQIELLWSTGKWETLLKGRALL